MKNCIALWQGSCPFVERLGGTSVVGNSTTNRGEKKKGAKVETISQIQSAQKYNTSSKPKKTSPQPS